MPPPPCFRLRPGRARGRPVPRLLGPAPGPGVGAAADQFYSLSSRVSLTTQGRELGRPMAAASHERSACGHRGLAPSLARCLVPASSRPRPGLVPASSRPRSGLVPASSRPRPGLVPASFRPRPGLVPASFRPRSGLVPASFRPRPGLVPAPLPGSPRPSPRTSGPHAGTAASPLARSGVGGEARRPLPSASSPVRASPQPQCYIF